MVANWLVIGLTQLGLQTIVVTHMFWRLGAKFLFWILKFTKQQGIQQPHQLQSHDLAMLDAK